MIQAKCIDKFRDKQGRIIGYKLVDLNCREQDISAENLKLAILNGDIHVVNLTLSKDGRLMNKNEDKLPCIERVAVNKDIDDLAKALTLVDWSLIDMGDSYEEVVEYLLMEAGIKFNDILYDEDEKILFGLSINAYKIIIVNNPEYIRNKMQEILNDEYVYKEIKGYMYAENVSKVSDSKMYKSVYTIYKYFKDTDKKIAKQIKDILLDDMRTNGVVSIRVGYDVGHKYFEYLDSNVFGTITNCHYTVGHAITADEKKEFKELKPYTYMCSKDFNLLSPRPEVGIVFLFKNGEKGFVTVDVKLSRKGYVGKCSISTVGYMKDICTFSLTINNEDNAKIVANFCNKLGVKVKELTSRNQSLLKLLPLGAPVERI